MNMIWNWMQSFERLMCAVTFAEADQWRFARYLMAEKRPTARKRPSARVEKQAVNRPQMRV